jgi:hypothetical protein
MTKRSVPESCPKRCLKFALQFIGLFLILTTIFSCTKNDDNNNTTNTSVIYSIADLQATWQRHSLVTVAPSNGYWIYGTSLINANTVTLNLTLPSGTWDTSYSAQDISIAQNGIISLSYDHVASTYMSSDKNFIVGTTKRMGEYTLIIDQKNVSNTNYSLADLQGNWQIHDLVGGGGWSGWVHGLATFDNNGNFTMNNVVKSDGSTNSSNGKFSIASTGNITINGDSTFNGFMSSDKQLMVTNMTDGGGGGSLGIFQKVTAGTTYSVADLQGTWQLHDLLVGSENWSEHGIMTIDAKGNGIISDMVKDNGGTYNNPGTITITLTSGGIATFGTDYYGFVSADKKTVFGTRGDDSGNAYILVVLQKMP